METVGFQATVKNGVIEIPDQYQQELEAMEVVEVIVKKAEKQPKKISGFLKELIENPIMVKDFKPLTRDEIYDRNLDRDHHNQ
ncbi:MAG: hypothetical protein KME35_06365 [Aphanocapsa sp. GSE-SYN-MK-11-07L]|jgi:hypothetical protein|nr:hypothetical protein [Aphanocapsa sp. GSE-SYN-MK-11-07L]